MLGATLWLALVSGAAAQVQSAQAAAVAKAGALNLKSSSVIVLDQSGLRVLYAKNVERVMPIASITKVMTALIVLEEKLPLDERIVIAKEDVDRVKRTPSRLRVGATLTRGDLLKLALMASENRAAAALARAYPGGTQAFVAAMNQKALELGMVGTLFVDGTGLSRGNLSTAQDLVWLVEAAYRHPLIREYTTASSYNVELDNGRRMSFRNSNRLVMSQQWEIGLSKTGYLDAAGRCLVMQARIGTTPVIIVLLHSWGHLTRIGDANRIKKWIESNSSRQPAG